MFIILLDIPESDAPLTSLTDHAHILSKNEIYLTLQIPHLPSLRAKEYLTLSHDYISQFEETTVSVLNIKKYISSLNTI